MAITQEQATALLDIIGNPEKAGKLSVDQLKEAQTSLQEFQQERQALAKQLQGMTPEQAARVNAGMKAERRPSLTPAPQLASGVKEGLTQLAEGAFDVAWDISVGLHLGTDEGRQKYKAAVQKERVERRVQQIESFGGMPPKGTEIVGQVLPFVLAAPAEAPTLAGLAIKRALQGGAASSMVFQDDGTFTDRIPMIAVGGSLGLASAATNIWGGLKNYAGRGFTRAFNSTEANQALAVQKAVQEMTKRGDFGFSVAQSTGARFAFGVELSAANKATKAAQNRNIEILGKHIITMARAQSKAGKSAGQIATGLRNTLKEARKKIYAEASSTFAADSEALLLKHGENIVVDGQAYLDKVGKLVAETEDTLVAVGAKPSAALSRYYDEVDTLVNPAKVVQSIDPKTNKTVFFVENRRTNKSIAFGPDAPNAAKAAIRINEQQGGLNSEESLRILKGLNKLIGGDTAIFKNVPIDSNRNVGRALMGEFVNSLDGPAADAVAVADLKAMRGLYKDQMARAQAIDDLVVTQAFGGAKMPKQPGKRLDMVLKQEKEDLVATREFLEEWNPELLDDLRATHLKRIVSGSRNPTNAAVDSALDLNKLSTRLSNGFEGAGQAGKGLHTAATQADMVRTATALRILNNKYFKGIVPGGVRVEEMAINAISRSPEFMGRFIARAVGGGGSAERAMLNPEFRAAMQKLANEPVGGQAGQAAMLYLAMWINQEDKIRARVQKEELRQLAIARGVVNDPSKGQQ